MILHGLRDEGQHLARLLPAGFDHAEHGFHEPAAGRVLVPKESFRQITACRSACSLALLVGSTPSGSTKWWHDRSSAAARPEPVAMIEQLAAHAAKPATTKIHSAKQQGLDPSANRRHHKSPAAQRVGAVTVARPMPKLGPRGAQQVVPEARRVERCCDCRRIAAAFLKGPG